MATKEEIQKLLRKAIAPLEEKVDNLNHNFQELKKTVAFLNQKYDEVLSQLRQTNEKVQFQGTNPRKMQQDYDNVKLRSSSLRSTERKLFYPSIPAINYVVR